MIPRSITVLISVLFWLCATKTCFGDDQHVQHKKSEIFVTLGRPVVIKCPKHFTKMVWSWHLHKPNHKNTELWEHENVDLEKLKIFSRFYPADDKQSLVITVILSSDNDKIISCCTSPKKYDETRNEIQDCEKMTLKIQPDAVLCPHTDSMSKIERTVVGPVSYINCLCNGWYIGQTCEIGVPVFSWVEFLVYLFVILAAIVIGLNNYLVNTGEQLRASVNHPPMWQLITEKMARTKLEKQQNMSDTPKRENDGSVQLNLRDRRSTTADSGVVENVNESAEEQQQPK